jgi:hypothetical protein
VSWREGRGSVGGGGGRDARGCGDQGGSEKFMINKVRDIFSASE